MFEFTPKNSVIEPCNVYVRRGRDLILLVYVSSFLSSSSTGKKTDSNLSFKELLNINRLVLCLGLFFLNCGSYTLYP